MDSLKIFIENADVVEIYFPIVLVFIGFVAKKLYPYLETKVRIYKYYNVEMAFNLVQYQLLGTIIGLLVAIIGTSMFGRKSTWETTYFVEFFESSIIICFIYLLGIVWIITRRKENCKLFRNLLYAFGIYFLLFTYLSLGIWVIEDDNFKIIVDALIGFVLLMQLFENINRKKTKNIRYIIYTDEKKYRTMKKPVRKENCMIVRLTSKEGKIKEIVEIPNEKVKRVKYIVNEIIDNSV